MIDAIPARHDYGLELGHRERTLRVRFWFGQIRAVVEVS